jgi:hypothetical protein
MKKLIYFTLNNNPSYLELAKLCLQSLNLNNYDGDILFITNLKKEILENLFINNNVFFLDVPDTGLLNSSANKLKIYKFSDIKKYDKIIYCDLDILFLKSPDIIFNEIKEDKIYISNEDSLMTEKYWSSNLLKTDEKEKIIKEKIQGLNAGFFAFNKNMVEFFEKIDIFFEENQSSVNECLEQPFINVFLFRNFLYNNSLNKLISHNGYNLKTFDGVVLHFAGGPGNYGGKINHMNNFFNKNFYGTV